MPQRTPASAASIRRRALWHVRLDNLQQDPGEDGVACCYAEYLATLQFIEQGHLRTFRQRMGNSNALRGQSRGRAAVAQAPVWARIGGLREEARRCGATQPCGPWQLSPAADGGPIVALRGRERIGSGCRFAIGYAIGGLSRGLGGR
jgi:hypothetical protein